MYKWNITSESKKFTIQNISNENTDQCRDETVKLRVNIEILTMVEIDLPLSVISFDNIGSSAHQFAFLYLFLIFYRTTKRNFRKCPKLSN
jgi:hypothetical protein